MQNYSFIKQRNDYFKPDQGFSSHQQIINPKEVLGDWNFCLIRLSPDFSVNHEKCQENTAGGSSQFWIGRPTFRNNRLNWPTVLCSGLSFKSDAIDLTFPPYFSTNGCMYLSPPDNTGRGPTPELERWFAGVFELDADVEIPSSSVKIPWDPFFSRIEERNWVDCHINSMHSQLHGSAAAIYRHTMSINESYNRVHVTGNRRTDL